MTNSVKLFLLGVGVHLIYVIIILISESTLSDFWQKDTGQLTEILADFIIDSRSYIELADNFMEYGVFGSGENPDYHRTIGYPFIIYLFKALVGPYWYFGLVFFQTFFGALVYPLTYHIGKILFPEDNKSLYFSALALLGLAGYFTKSPYVMPDLACAVFFLLGIYLSMHSIKEGKNIKLLILGIASLSFSALVRPNLMLYPIAHFLLLFYIAKLYDRWNERRTRRMVWLSGMALIITCNLSSFRMYHSYGIISPTNVLGINMFEYTVKKVLTKEGQLEEYNRMEQMVNNEEHWMIRDKMRKEYFFGTISQYPMSAVQYWLRAGIDHFVTPHHMEIGVAYGYYKRDKVDGNIKLEKSRIVAAIFYIGSLVNLLILGLCCLFLITDLSVHKNYLLLISICVLVAIIVGPSCLAQTSPRMRIPIEPFILLLSFKYPSGQNRMIAGHKMTKLTGFVFFRWLAILRISARYLKPGSNC